MAVEKPLKRLGFDFGKLNTPLKRGVNENAARRLLKDSY